MMQSPFYRRIAVWNDTERTAPALKGEGSTKYSWDPDFRLRNKYGRTLVYVVDKDLIDLARACQHNPLVVNPSDDCFPGGCVNVGSGAAEESLFRRSNYFRSLTLRHYPIKPNEAVYSPRITVFKEGEDLNFEKCEPFDVNFLACPGLRHPILTSDGKLNQGDIEILERKIELILQVAQKRNHPVVIMAAIGCGAWKNPARDVADAFKRVLDRHDGVVKVIMFAIKRNTEKNYIARLDSSRLDNYLTFFSTFKRRHRPKREWEETQYTR